MNTAASCDRMRIPVAPSSTGWLGDACAKFWLSVMFYLSRQAPGVIRTIEPFGSWGTWKCSQQFRRETEINARRIFGPDVSSADRERYGRSVVNSFYEFVFDLGRTSIMSRDQLRAQIAGIEGADGYKQTRMAGGGAIIATAHMGSFELGMTAMLEVEREIHVVFQRDANPLFERLRSDFRKRVGIHEAAVDEGWAMWLGLRDALARDAVVAIQADRAMPGQVGVKVPLLGGHAFFPEGPAKLAAITGSPIIPVFAIRRPDGKVKLFIEQAIHVPEATDIAICAAIAKLADVVGEYIRRYPGQWLVANRAWCEDIEN